MATHHHQVQPQYVHYAGPPGASSASSSAGTTTATQTTTKTTPQAVLNGAVASSSLQSSSTNTAPTPTTVAPQDTTHHHYHQYQHVVHPHSTHAHATHSQHVAVAQPIQYHHAVVAPPPTQSNSVTPFATPANVQATSTSARTTPAPAGVAGASVATGNGPLVATGDWTKDLIHLAKTAELKKHALTLQLHTAHILSAHASLEQKSKAIQDVKEQRNKLESERTRLLQSLRQVNEDRDKADLMEASIEKECADLRAKITELSDGDYAIAKRDVDRLRAELGQPPLPTLQSMLDEKKAQYLKERRINGNGNGNGNSNSNTHTPNPTTPQLSHVTQPTFGATSTATSSSAPGSASGAGKRNAPEDVASGPTVKRPRGRPKGSKNRKPDSTSGSGGTGAVGGGGTGGGGGGGGTAGIPGTGTM